MTEYIQRLLFSPKTIPSPEALSQYYKDVHLIKQPFSFRSDGTTAVLLIHGWSSTPYELRALGIHLRDAGHTVHAPLLRGHGTKPQDLEGVQWHEWLEDVDRAYTELSARYEKVYIGGMSVGGSLALLLAKRYPEITGLILMGTPYRMRNQMIGRISAHLAGLIQPYHRKHYPKFGNRPPEILRMASYQEYPIKNALEAFDAICAGARMLKKIRQPLFIIQSETDHLIDRDSAHKIARKTASTHVEKKMLPHAYHNFISDPQHYYLFDLIEKFIARH